MGIFNKFGKKGKEQEAMLQNESFVYGVEDVFSLKDSEDVLVAGIVKGTVKQGMAVYVTNIGDDENTTLLTTIVSLDMNRKQVDSASDCPVALRLQQGKRANIKPGSVVFTKDRSTGDIHTAYINAIGNSYVATKKLELSPKDTDIMSITDMVEAWRLFAWMKSKTTMEDSQEEKQVSKEKIEKLADALVDKLLGAEEIYVVFNKLTGEPHMFSRTIAEENGTYRCTPPDIRVIPKAYASVYASQYSQNDFELRKIENGEDKKGIYNFLGSTFYLNGACGIEVIGGETAINADKMVPPPDYSNMPQINIPVTNPDLVRWMLLMGQLKEMDTPDMKIIGGLYQKFFFGELLKAKLLVPMQKEGEIPKPDENGQTVLEEGLKIQFPTMQGKHDRDAVHMYTDWKRLRMVFGEEWSGMIQTVAGMIEVYDCVINATDYPAAGCYVDREMFAIAQKIEK